MNSISCVFLSQNTFIINVFDDINDDNYLGYIISMCIKFNKKIDDTTTKFNTYKGIVIFKNIENFTDNKYIIVDVLIKNSKYKNSIIQQFNSLVISPKDSKKENFINFLETELNQMLDQNNAVNCYHSSYDGNNYEYNINNNIKIDLSIIYYYFLEIKHKNPVDWIELTINN